MLSLLRRVINPVVQLKHADKKLVFIEADKGTRLKGIEFKLTQFITDQGGLLKNTVVISSDLDEDIFAKFSHFLADDCPDINRKCDYIIFHQKDNDLRVILFEMKSSIKGVSGRCPAQFDISQVFADYLINLSKTYATLYDIADVETLTLKYFKVVFYPNLSLAHGNPVGVNPLLRSK